MTAVLLVGATGGVGTHLLNELLLDDSVARINVLSRKQISFQTDELKSAANAKMTLLQPYNFSEQNLYELKNFDNVDEFSRGNPDVFAVEDVFCALGTTRKQAGSAENFVKIDFDYVMKIAAQAQNGGAQNFHLVSSAGASPASLFLYPRTKGRLEKALKERSFRRLFVYRPALLVNVVRSDCRPAEACARSCCAPFFSMCFPGRFCTDAEQLAALMVKNAAVGRFVVPCPSFCVFSSSDIFYQKPPVPLS